MSYMYYKTFVIKMFIKIKFKVDEQRVRIPYINRLKVTRTAIS